MNDFPKSQDEYNERYMATPPEQKFKSITRCLDCGEQAYVYGSLDGLMWYDGCNCGKRPIYECEKYIIVYQCSLCLEEHETEECNCYNK